MCSNGRADGIEPPINWHFKWRSEATEKEEQLGRTGGLYIYVCTYVCVGVCVGSHVEAQNG